MPALLRYNWDLVLKVNLTRHEMFFAGFESL